MSQHTTTPRRHAWTGTPSVDDESDVDRLALSLYASMGMWDMFDTLLRRQPEVRVDRSVIELSFLDACSLGNEQVAGRLLKHDPAVVDAFDGMALSESCRRGHFTIVTLLVSNGADVRRNHDRAFVNAVSGRHLHVARFLLSMGADVHVNDDVCLCAAVDAGDLDLVRLLLCHSANPHACAELPLHLAVSTGRMDILRLLVEASTAAS